MQIPLLARIAAIAATLTFSSLGRAAEPNWPDHLTIGTASPGGTYFVYGTGLAQILTRALDLPVVARPTEGPAENIALLEAGEAKLGFVTVGVALQAWNGTGVWAGKAPARSMRAIFPMYDTPFQLLALQDTNIRSIADMADKRIGVGPRGGTSATYFPDIFNALKVKANFVFGDWADLASQIHARSIDVLAVAAGVPFPSFIELEFKDKVRYIALSPEQLAGAAAGNARADAVARARRHISIPASPLSDGGPLQFRCRARRAARRSRLQHRSGRLREA